MTTTAPPARGGSNARRGMGLGPRTTELPVHATRKDVPVNAGAETRTCPPSAVRDLFVSADEVEAGDLMLIGGVLASVEQVIEDHSQPAYVCLVVSHPRLGDTPHKVWRIRDLLCGVRRYDTEGEPA